MKQPREEFGPNTWLLEDMYRRYMENPAGVSEAWREFFDGYSPSSEAPRHEQISEEAELSPHASPLTGADALVAQRMSESLSVPTATSVRTIPAKLLEVNRNILNNHLRRVHRGKASFTHLIAYAVVRALTKHPEMNTTFQEAEGKPHAIAHEDVNLGIAVDVRRPDGTRTLMVPNIKGAQRLDFGELMQRYDDLLSKVSAKKLSPDDFAGTTVTITNPGMLGTVQSVPRLMESQAVIVGVGSIDFPAEFAGADPKNLADVGIGKVVTLTSTYDHRVIQGAASGEFLAAVHSLLLGEDHFYEEVFESIGVPYVPVKWLRDTAPGAEPLETEDKQARVLTLINLYRVRGHLIADLDPLEMEPPEMHPELDPAHHGLTIWDLDRTFSTGGLAGTKTLPLSEILRILRDAYCRTGTIEYMHISDHVQKEWVQDRIEGSQPPTSRDDQRRILTKLNEAEAFETFLHRKYVGHKRFSLEGAESLIPMLDAILLRASQSTTDEIVIGMAHRGRLNVLANIIGKGYGDIFRQFEGDIDPTTSQGSGDVKYHLGAKGTFRDGEKNLPLTLASNPSHLESVDPVVEGMARAKQDLHAVPESAPVLPILIHGDAAFAGQGVVAETLNLSQLSGYRVGGTVHIIVNNQLGFTTGSDYGRSSTYASDVGKMVQAPIFHVNGDDPEACIRVARLAVEFREAFRRDVIIDMWCYRRWGHNEADEPAFTQPLMFAKIQGRRSIRKLYTESLITRGDLDLEEAEAALEEFRSKLQEAFDQTTQEGSPKGDKALQSPKTLPGMDTGVRLDDLKEIVGALTAVPKDFNLHPKLERWLEARRKALEMGSIDFSLAEALAIGSLLREGTSVRLSGQDTRRGTFSQRHATLVDQANGREHTPLASLGPGHFHVYDSLLSEFAALGFEYGYSAADPDALVIWEAQFGDFANGGQVIIDQFIAAGEDKWSQPSSVVLFLPHGYEGQGPEHSSARLERFLQLCAEDNMQVAVPSSASQLFHLLRRQARLGEARRPLIVMTPKSYLRIGESRSPLSEFETGSFNPVIPDGEAKAKVIMCSGKVFYDIAAAEPPDDFALVRLEQLYPFPAHELREALSRHPGAGVRWVQEEPENMGAWRFVQSAMASEGFDIEGVTRPESASPATGSATGHQREQEELLARALS